MFPERFTINSSLNSELIRRKLLEVVEPPQRNIWSFRKTNKPYEGEISEYTFKIRRIINYRNSFLPVIQGRISSEGMGSKIEIEMRLHTFVFMFILFWLGTVGNISILSFLSMIYERKFDPDLLIPFGMFTFGFLLASIAFKFETKVAKKFLIDLLTGN
jgi:hypothetical protein